MAMMNLKDFKGVELLEIHLDKMDMPRNMKLAGEGLARANELQRPSYK